MKKKFLYGIIIVFCAAVCFVAGSYAGEKLEEIHPYLNHGISIAKDGKIVTLHDSNRNKMTPITYNDLTYLPVRALSNLLGHEIDWDSDAQCVLIDNSEVPDELIVQKPQSDIVIPDITDGKMEIDYIYKLIDKVGNGKLKFVCSESPAGVEVANTISDGIWNAQPDYSGDAIADRYYGIGYSYYGNADVVTVDGAPADEIEAFYKAFCDALVYDGYNLKKTDEEGVAHYTKAEAEFMIKNIDNKTFDISAATRRSACCAVVNLIGNK